MKLIFVTQNGIIKSFALRLLFVFLLTGISSLHAQMVTVAPTEYPDALSNPWIGFRPGLSGNPNWNAKKYPTLYRHYIYWNEIENLETDGVQKIINFCNAKWAGCEAANVKIIPRVILQYTSYYFPSYLTAGDYKSEKTRQAVVRMIAKLGQAWDKDPRVAWVQTGIIGKWGEQESPVNVDDPVVAPDNSTWAKILGQEYVKAFPNKMLIVRNQDDFAAEGFNGMGVYWDSFAHTGQYTGAWTDILNTNKAGRYFIAPVEGEVAYNWGDGRVNFGYTPTENVTNPAYYNYVINTIKQLHTSALGWISDYTEGAATATGANLLQKAMGYRFHITEFKCSQRAEPGGTLTMSAKIKNIGSAPIYYNWPVAFILVNETTRQIVHQSIISGTDIRKWLPGSNFDWDGKNNLNGSKVYLTPAVDNSISATITIPSGIKVGQYLAGLAILDPSTNKPGVFFAVNSFFKQSQSQPLCRIGIGADASDNTLTGPFDHPVNDDARYYSKEITLSEKTISEQNSVRVYPNPVSNILYIDFPNAELSREIKVFNTMGQLIYSVQTKNATAQIDVQSLKHNGVVMVQVINENEISNHKIVVK